MESVEILGFHGTFVDCIESIMKQGFLFNWNGEHWLGNGVYFYKDDHDAALMWARGQQSNKKECYNRTPAVFRAIITSDRNCIADLNIRDDQRKLENFIKSLAGVEAKKKVIFDKHAEKKNACAIYDAYAESENIKVIVKTFAHQSPNLKKLNECFNANLGIYYTEQQVCVKDLVCISSTPECVHRDKPRSPRRDKSDFYSTKKKSNQSFTWRGN